MPRTEIEGKETRADNFGLFTDLYPYVKCFGSLPNKYEMIIWNEYIFEMILRKCFWI